MPYDVELSSMLTTADNTLLLVGGFSSGKILGSILQLKSVVSSWREIPLPVSNFRASHLALPIEGTEEERLCGKFKRIQSMRKLNFLDYK